MAENKINLIKIIKNYFRKKLIKSSNDKNGWYCIGRQRKEDHVNYCEYAYQALQNNGYFAGCTRDCKFYRKLHPEPVLKQYFICLGEKLL